MTITNTDSQVSITGAGTADPIAIPFKFVNSSDLTVTERVITTGVETTKTEGAGADYTVSGGGGGGSPATGTVTPTAVIPATVTWTITRDTPLTQQSDYVNDSQLPLQTVEDDLDKTAMRDIELLRERTRSLKVPISDDTAISTEIPNSVDRASMYLGFDSNSEPVALAAPASTTALSAYMATVVLAADSDAAQVLLAGYKSGTFAARPLAADFSGGIYVATDTRELFRSNGTLWVQISGLLATNASFPAAGSAGRWGIDLDLNEALIDSGSGWSPIRSLPPGWKHGCEATHDSGTLTTVSAGSWRDSADGVNLTLAASMQKTFNSSGSWTEGAAGNMLSSGAPMAADTWYARFLIGKPDGTTDWGLDTSLTAANLLADATGYTRYRRIGWVKSNSTAPGSTLLLPLTQDGDGFFPDATITQVYGSGDYTGAGGGVVSTSEMLPPGPGIEGYVTPAFNGGVGADIAVQFARNGQTVPVATSIDAASPAAGNQFYIDFGAPSQTAGGHVHLYPTSASQVRMKIDGDSSVSFDLTTISWRDTRL